MALQFSISGQCNISFEQLEFADSMKAPVDTFTTKCEFIYARIYNKTTSLGKSVGNWKLCSLCYNTTEQTDMQYSVCFCDITFKHSIFVPVW